VDGLLIKRNDDFIKDIQKRGLKIKSIKVRFLIRDVGKRGHRYRNFNNLESFKLFFESILNSPKFLCSAGDFPIIENIELENQNLGFINNYKFYNISENRYFVKSIQYDSFRKDFFDKEVIRYESLLSSLFNIYMAIVNISVATRLNTYTDPCYVDENYVEKNYTKYTRLQFIIYDRNYSYYNYYGGNPSSLSRLESPINIITQ
jgi:hypothetical protein